MSRYQLLSVAEAAEQLKRKRWFVYKLLDNHKLAYYEVGGRRAIRQSDLDDYVARTRVPALGEGKSKKINFAEAAE